MTEQTTTLTTRGTMVRMRLVVDGTCIDVIARVEAPTAEARAVWEKIRNVLDFEAAGYWVNRDAYPADETGDFHGEDGL